MTRSSTPSAPPPPQPNQHRTLRAGGACPSCAELPSDVPGAAPMDETQQTAAAGNTSALLDRMAAMTQEQRDALLDNLI